MNLSLTLDYELFGNGSGDVFKDVIYPTEELLRILKSFNIKLTIFFEVVEYWKLNQEWLNGNKMNYLENPAERMKSQIEDAYMDGHDIQLHIHPQWLNAYYKEKWIVDSNWCMRDVPLIKNENNFIDLHTLIHKGKQTLENWLNPINDSYTCNIFRAGAFNILPSERIFPIIKDNNFEVDSSVYPGGYEINELSNIDYRMLSNKIPYWICKDHKVIVQSWINKNPLIHNEERHIIEFPIFSSPIIRILKYDINRIKELIRNRNVALEKVSKKIGNKTYFDKFRYFFQKEYATWDFCLFNDYLWKIFINRAKKIENHSNSSFHPFILIGHSKNFKNPKPFVKILKRYRDSFNFWTLSEILKKLNEK